MLARRVTVAGAATSLWVLAVAAAGVEPVTVPPRTSLYFHKEAHSHADYLELRHDGRYRRVDVQHLTTEESDSGRWEARGSNITLRSRHRPTDIVTREFRVYITDRADLLQLRQLREKLAAFLQRNTRRTISFKAVETISVDRQNSRGRLRIDLAVHFEADERRAEVDRAALAGLLREIDDYLRRPDVFTHFFRLLRHRGVEWLEPHLPNDEPLSPVSYVVDRINKGNGKPPDYLFVRVSQRQFARGAGSLYPFKFYPEMNEKVKALQPKR